MVSAVCRSEGVESTKVESSPSRTPKTVDSSLSESGTTSVLFSDWLALTYFVCRWWYIAERSWRRVAVRARTTTAMLYFVWQHHASPATGSVNTNVNQRKSIDFSSDSTYPLSQCYRIILGLEMGKNPNPARTNRTRTQMTWFLLDSFTEWNCRYIHTFHSKRGILLYLGVQIHVKHVEGAMAPFDLFPENVNRFYIFEMCIDISIREDFLTKILNKVAT